MSVPAITGIGIAERRSALASPPEIAAGQTRVAMTLETAKTLKAQGHAISVHSGAGIAASATGQAGAAAGAEGMVEAVD